MKKRFILPFLLTIPCLALAAPADVNFTVTMSEAVNVNTGSGTPRIAVNVDGQTRYATYSAGTGTSSLTFSYAPTIGDLDLDGVALTSPLDLNGGVITDLNGNPETDLTFTVPNTSGVKVDYPSLSMDFTNGTNGRYTLNGTAYTSLSSFLTAAGGSFIRSSTATYFDSTGTLQTASTNTPRFEYDPTTHAPKGILIERTFSNSLKSSENFTNATHWTPTNVALDSSGYISPAGIIGATKLIADPTNGAHNITSTVSGGGNVTAGIPITASAFVKAGEHDRIKLDILPTTIFPLVSGVQTAPSITVNLSTGTIITTANTTYSAIQQLPNGWYRVSWGQTTSNANSVRVSARILDSSNSQTFAGDGTSGLYLWGYQLLINSLSELSYMPSNGTWGVHSADTLTIPVASWYNPSAQTLFGRGFSSGKIITGTGASLADIDDNSWNERFQIRFIPTFKYGGVITDAGSVQATPSGGTYTLGNVKSVAMSAKTNDVALIADGSTIATSSSLTMGTSATQLRIGSAADGQEFLNGYIEDIKYYPQRSSDTQLQLLTQ